jgi:hypothetical protein
MATHGTNTSKAIPAAPAAPAGAPININKAAAATIENPYSKTIVNPGEAFDHAIMRARQLVDLLDVLGGTGPDVLMWLAQQIAGELVETIHMVESDARTGGAA